jgi:hypothetical protein
MGRPKNSGRTRGQAAAKYPWESRLIAWTLLLFLLVAAGFAAWHAIATGRAYRLIPLVLLAAWFAVRGCRRTMNA